jgi:Interferon-induced transmembrane protein
MNCETCGREYVYPLTECPHCRSLREADARRHITGPEGVAHGRGNSFLTPAIVLTLCTCPPCGILAIVFLHYADELRMAGDAPGSERMANKATACVVVGIGGGIFVIAALLISYVW